jgi:ketosteroid isomerase-like protein
MSEAQVETVRRFYAAFNRKDSAAAMALANDDVTVEEAPSFNPNPRSFRGIPQAQEYLESYYKVWETFSMEPAEIAEVGDGVVVATVDVTAVGRASSINISREVGHLFTFRDGKASRVVLYGRAQEALKAATGAPA